MVYNRMITVPVMVLLLILSKWEILKRNNLMKAKMISWMMRIWIYPYKKNIRSRICIYP